MLELREGARIVAVTSGLPFTAGTVDEVTDRQAAIVWDTAGGRPGRKRIWTALEQLERLGVVQVPHAQGTQLRGF